MIYILNLKGFSNTIIKKINLLITKLLNTIKVDWLFSSLPKKKKKIIVLKSPHIYKKFWEQFEIINLNYCFYIFMGNGEEYKKVERYIRLFSWSFFGLKLKKRVVTKSYLRIR